MSDTGKLKMSLSDLLFFPVMMPAKGFLFILNEIREMADREMNDPVRLQEKLIEVQVLYEMGDLDEATYRQTWLGLSERLREVKTAGRGDEYGSDGSTD